MKYPLWLVGLFQTLGLIAYVTLIGTFFRNANQLLGPVDTFFSPILALSLLVTSALVCSLISLTYPAILIWDKKQTKDAFKLLGFTVLWLLLFIAILLVGLATR